MSEQNGKGSFAIVDVMTFEQLAKLVEQNRYTREQKVLVEISKPSSAANSFMRIRCEEPKIDARGRIGWQAASL